MPWQVFDSDWSSHSACELPTLCIFWSDVEGETRLVNKQILVASAYMGLYFPLFSSCHLLPLQCDPKILSGNVWYIRHDLLHSATTHRFTPQRNINSDTRKMQPSGIDQASLGAGRNVFRGDVWGLSAKVLGWTRHLTCFRFRSWYIVVTQFPQSQPRLFGSLR